MRNGNVSGIFPLRSNPRLARQILAFDLGSWGNVPLTGRKLTLFIYHRATDDWIIYSYSLRNMHCSSENVFGQLTNLRIIMSFFSPHSTTPRRSHKMDLCKLAEPTKYGSIKATLRYSHRHLRCNADSLPHYVPQLSTCRTRAHPFPSLTICPWYYDNSDNMHN